MTSTQLTLALAACMLAASCTAPRQTQPAPPRESVDETRIDPPPPPAYGDAVAHRLDSLASISDGDYIHLEISQCFGRCEGHVSLYRASPAKFHIYDAEAWSYNEFERGDILYRSRRPIASDSADGLLATARDIGIMKLANDTSMLVTDQPYIWLRARINGKAVSVNKAYVGGRHYAGDVDTQALHEVYSKLRQALLAPLFSGPSDHTTAPPH